ncbi:MAG: hypothetical protein IIB77_14480 [Proteobacteria bacterium]|nr:hypothetical protein [Pseudomonadota bacterium]
MADTDILEILTKSARPTFTIDGKRYEMRHPNELSMTEFYDLSKTGSVLSELGDHFADDPEASFEKIHGVIKELLDTITPDLPQNIRDELNPFHVMKILEAFIGLSRITPQPDDEQAQAKSLQDSSDSTAQRRSTG